jgi:thymidylate kinase
MRLIIAGCEYSGASTLAHAIGKWAKDAMGADMTIYDSFKIPHILPLEMTDEELEQVQALPAHLKQVFQWHNLASHTMPEALKADDYILVGLQIDEAVYPPMYHEYGRTWEYAEAVNLARHYELHIVEYMPYMVQVLVKASPEVIVERLEKNPHKYGLLEQGRDAIVPEIEHLLERFDEVASKSLVRRKITLDTSTATVEETVADFAEKMGKYMTTSDLRRIAAHS